MAFVPFAIGGAALGAEIAGDAELGVGIGESIGSELGGALGGGGLVSNRHSSKKRMRSRILKRARVHTIATKRAFSRSVRRRNIRAARIGAVTLRARRFGRARAPYYSRRRRHNSRRRRYRFRR